MSFQGKCKPPVSVVVGTYQQADLLRECLEGIANQTYTNFQLVIADDASTDHTDEIVRNFSLGKAFPITYVKAERNRGVAETHQMGIDHATGEILVFIAGDDLMYPERVESQVDLLLRYPKAGLAYHQLDILNGGEVVGVFNNLQNPARQGDARVAARYGSFMGASSIAVWRKSLPTRGIDRRLKYAYDWQFWVECAITGGTIVYDDVPRGAYRRHEGSLTLDPKMQRLLLEEHLMSCSILAARYPSLLRPLEKRRLQLMLSLTNLSVESGHLKPRTRFILSRPDVVLDSDMWRSAWRRIVKSDQSSASRGK